MPLIAARDAPRKAVSCRCAAAWGSVLESLIPSYPRARPCQAAQYRALGGLLAMPHPSAVNKLAPTSTMAKLRSTRSPEKACFGKFHHR
jgi:hypothetical protein